MKPLLKSALVAAPVAMSLSGCFIPVIPKQETPKFDPPKFEYDNKQIDEILKDFEARGGQPGPIKITGLITIYRDDGDEDRARTVKVTARAGLNHQGERIKLDGKFEPKFDKTVPEPLANSLDSAFETDLFVFGCEGREVPGHSVDGSAPEPAESDAYNPRTKSIRAKKIILCGKNPFDAQQSVFITANELLLVDLDYVKVGTMASSVNINAEKLFLFGQNSIKSIGLKGNDVGYTQSPELNINVRYTVFFMGEGSRLSLSSEGPSYEAAPATNSN